MVLEGLKRLVEPFETVLHLPQHQVDIRITVQLVLGNDFLDIAVDFRGLGQLKVFFHEHAPLHQGIDQLQAGLIFVLHGDFPLLFGFDLGCFRSFLGFFGFVPLLFRYVFLAADLHVGHREGNDDNQHHGCDGRREYPVSGHPLGEYLPEAVFHGPDGPSGKKELNFFFQLVNSPVAVFLVRRHAFHHDGIELRGDTPPGIPLGRKLGTLFADLRQDLPEIAANIWRFQD